MQAALRRFTSAPRLVIWSCLVLVVAVAAQSLLESNADLSWLAVCRALPLDASWGSIFVVWAAMSLAMMLPTAFPMISAYLDIAEAAKAKSADCVSPVILAFGFAVVWLGFSGLAATLQLFAARYGDAVQSPVLAVLLFILAGLYQFSPLKHSCLSKCRRPMPYFMANWTTELRSVFKMGLHQGALCLGCCWALMALGFAAGLMNLAWMAALCLIMVLEKTLPEPKPVIYGLGIGLIAAGVVMIGLAA